MQTYGDDNMKMSNNMLVLLWPYIWSDQSALQKFKVMVFVLCTILTTLVFISVPLLLKQVILVLETQAQLYYLTPIMIVIGYALAWMLIKVVDRFRHQAAFPMISNLIRCLCLDLFSHLQCLSMRFHHHKKSGKIFNVVSRTRYAIAGFTMAIAQEIVPLFLQIISSSLVLTYYYGVLYGLVLLGVIFLYMLLSIKTAAIIISSRRQQNKVDGEANAFIVDSILNAETVKYFGTEKYEAQQAKKRLLEKQQADIDSLMSDAKVHLLQHTIIGMAVILLTLMSGFAVLNNNLHVSDFVMINSMILMLTTPLNALGYRYREMKLQLTHLESAFELLNEPVEIQDAKGAAALVYKSGLIEFENVDFGYNADRMILQGISFTANPGTTTAIVGASGSGKSTIAKLIFRLYDVNGGAIKIDGQNVKQITHGSIGDVIGIVSQDPAMFHDSIKNNIMYSLQDSNIDLTAILQSVELYDFIENLPDGLATWVGERGVKLSGGERQRLSIARLLARKPKIMILDEATSALDLQTERKVQNCLLDAAKGITTIIIAHRLSTIKHADNIIVLDDGKIVEQGTHAELISNNATYAKLLAKQDRRG